MMEFIKQWFEPPIFEGDEEKTRRANLLNATTTLGLIYISLFISINLLGRNTQTSGVVIVDTGVFLTTLLFRYWLRQGKVSLVGSGSVILTFIWTTLVGVSLGTIRTPTTATYLFVVIFSGFLFDWSGILISSIASSLAVMGLVLAENAGVLPQPDYTVTFTQWFTYTSLFVFTGYLSFFMLQTIRKALVTAEREIAERKRVENELRKLTRAVEQSPASIVITNLDGNIEYVNPRFTQVTGYRLDEVAGRNPRILKTDLTPPETHRQLWDTVTTGKEWRGEFVDKKKDGSLYYESAIISPITDQNGIITHYLAVKEDITARKQMEKSLNEMRSRLHLLGDNLEEAALYVYSHDTEGKPHFEYLSAGIEKLIGVKIEDALQDASRLHSLILPEYISSLIELEEKSKQDLLSFEMETRQQHAVTGNIHWALLRSTPRRRPDGSTVWYGVQMDITERKRSEKLLEEANEQLRADMEKIEQLQEELREQAIRDPLTGLFNRRHLNEAVTREVVRAGRENVPLSVIISDIDHFKMTNDTYGHSVGDKFLVEIANLMKSHARGSDIVCRYGGEEFLLVLPGTTTDSAAKRAEEIRQRCAEIVIKHEGKDLRATMSFGVATYPDHGREAEKIIIKADKALYESKHSGRNRVTVWNKM